MLRVSRLSDPLRVQQELGWYNRLLPGRGTLQAALLLDLAQGADWAEQVAFWQNLDGEHLRLHIGDAVAATRFVTCRPEDRCAGAAHWVSFSVADAIKLALPDRRRAVYLEADFREYQHRSALLTDAMRRSLLDDLEVSSRRRAA
jgi:hypothetical protein